MDNPRAGSWLACFLFLAAAGAATCAEPAGILTMGEALERAATANLQVSVHAAQVESARARARHMSQAPPLALTTQLENIAGGGELRGFDSAESTLQISRLIELGGKRNRRRALGEAMIAQADHALHSAVLDARSLAMRRFIEVVGDQERLALAVEWLALAERTRVEVERVVRHARNPESDLRAAEISVAEAELEREHAEHELRAARVTLAATWGVREPDFATAVLPWESLPEPEPFEAMAGLLPGSADLLALKLESDTADVRQRLSDAESRPDLTVGLGIRRLEAFDDQGLVMSVSIPLGSTSRARHLQAESRADALALARRHTAVEIDNYQQLFERYQELGHARSEFQALTESMIPKARAALDVATRGFELGRFPFLTLAQTQASLFELRRRRIDAAVRFHQLFAELQRRIAAAEVP